MIRNLRKARTRKKRTGRSTEPTLTSTASELEAQPVILHRGSGAARTSTKHGPTSDEVGQRVSETVPSHECCYIWDWGCAESYRGQAWSWQSKHLSDFYSRSFIVVKPAENDLETLQGNYWVIGKVMTYFSGFHYKNAL